MPTGPDFPVAHAFWAAHLGCSPTELFTAPWHLIVHGSAWADYDGVFAIFRGGGAVVSVPAKHADGLRELLAPLSQGGSPRRLADLLGPITTAVIGPSYIGYAETIAPPAHPARELGPDDAPALAALQQACAPDEWEHGGSDPSRPHAAVFADGQLAALAGYEVWDGVIAHLYVVTHPAFRGRGLGSSAVAWLAGRAVFAGLLPQYRTLAANRASVRVAERLGFQAYATALSIRLGHGL